ncbi:hypothetical protein GLAREA_09581 [Glarea lozoyensis ATCC 20868]|uniref:Uncharacterized protein n=1 Tax=Glarea lozoyensis (strain ATCC 20868 / MF5171) TaxID=1116229 RepID=S3CS07_GLAL2|nr:uncharacterized protein GLAREA_09581 [Glarea lozoyensis ATCC 20868]EPE28460.1 hypothetical protein GLAREA_09581 [Glarea lozoyensis ATCC 20868]
MMLIPNVRLAELHTSCSACSSYFSAVTCGRLVKRMNLECGEASQDFYTTTSDGWRALGYSTFQGQHRIHKYKMEEHGVRASGPSMYGAMWLTETRHAKAWEWHLATTVEARKKGQKNAEPEQVPMPDLSWYRNFSTDARCKAIFTSHQHEHPPLLSPPALDFSAKWLLLDLVRWTRFTSPGRLTNSTERTPLETTTMSLGLAYPRSTGSQIRPFSSTPDCERQSTILNCIPHAIKTTFDRPTLVQLYSTRSGLPSLRILVQ